MTGIRVALLEEFRGGTVVLLAMDSAGLGVFSAALDQALTYGAWRFGHQRRIHQYQLQAGAADVELHDTRVEWRLDHAKTVEMIDKLTAMRNSGPCHQYVDISTPTDTLVLCVDEYIHPAWLARSPFSGG